MHYEEQQRKLMKNLMSEAYYDDLMHPRSIDTDPNDDDEDASQRQVLDQTMIEELDMKNFTGAINNSFYGRNEERTATAAVRKRKSTQYEEYENSPEGSF